MRRKVHNVPAGRIIEVTGWNRKRQYIPVTHDGKRLPRVDTWDIAYRRLHAGR